VKRAQRHERLWIVFVLSIATDFDEIGKTQLRGISHSCQIAPILICLFCYAVLAYRTFSYGLINRMQLRMNGRQVIITGGSKGIGEAAARAFAQLGCNVHLVARNETRLRTLCDELSTRDNIRATYSAVSLDEPDAANIVADACRQADVLINNAGDIPNGSIEQLDNKRWKASWDVKIFSAIALSRLFLEGMKQRKSGVIINVIGIAGDLLDGTYIAGSVGNAALAAFTKALGAWTPQFGIRVVGVNPGAVATDRLERIHRQSARELYGDETRWPELSQSLPFGRAARPEEVADAMTYLASDQASYISGSILTIDGGVSAGRRIV
jgi:NAD(P)-dependent dehydrogenase (short-subunit alcohol dehydrogenase family)